MSLQLGLRFCFASFRNNQLLPPPDKVWKRIFAVSFSDKIDPSLRRDDDKLVERKPLSGYVYSEEIEGLKSKWRIPFIERKSFFRSKLAAFASKKFKADITRLNPEHFKYVDIKKWWNTMTEQKLVFDQQFNEERLMALGCDLAAAHFTVYRGGAVKFVGDDRWIRDDKTNSEYDQYLPNTYNPNYAVEAIDFSNTRIVYEGLSNIDNLRSLKWLSFANCSYFDDWCLDRVSGQHRNNLEYLDLSFTKVTYRGLYALYRLNKLKTLKLDESNDDPLFFQSCLELKKEFKGLNLEIVSSEPNKVSHDRV